MDYSEVWYLGLDAKKMKGSPSLPHNSGYDDESGGYLKVTKMGTKMAVKKL